MLFNSLSFLGSFAVFVVLYYATAHRYRWMLLVVASLAYYSTFRPAHVLLLIFVAAVTYAAGLAIESLPEARWRKAVLAVSIASVLAALVIVRYLQFFMRSVVGVGLAPDLADSGAAAGLNLAAVAGLSFYTFSCVSYLADVYRRRLPAERHAGYFLMYVAFFPKLLAGPIERARPFLEQLRQPVIFRDAQVTSGLQLVLLGLFKKVVIGDRLAVFVDAIYRQPAFSSSADLVLATYFFAFQLYCDFSGYSDIAIGTSKVLGLDLAENFRRPFLSMSVPEFWSQRWHLSLAHWFRDYMYIPLGGNRVSMARQVLNILAVFLVSGLWHGANWTFVIWGGLNGLYVAASLWLKSAAGPGRARLAGIPPSLRAVGRRILTFHLILVTWVFFRAASVQDAVVVLSRVGSRLDQLPALLARRIGSADVFPLIAITATLVVVESFDERRPVWERLQARPVYARWAVYYAALFCLVVFGIWNFQQFVYMQF